MRIDVFFQMPLAIENVYGIVIIRWFLRLYGIDSFRLRLVRQTLGVVRVPYQRGVVR